MQIPGLQYWFVSSDLSNGITASNWIDRVQGAVLTNGAPSKRPTMDNNGCLVFNLQYITNRIFGVSNQTTMCLIMSPDHLPASGTESFFTDGPPTTSIQYRFFAPNQWALQNGPLFTEVIGRTNDIIVTINGLKVADDLVITNGVTVGGISVQGTGTAFGVVGGLADSFGPGQFHIRELLWYTNSNFATNATAVALFHKYATNTYNYAP
jgi:hypothetical protein